MKQNLPPGLPRFPVRDYSLSQKVPV